MQSVVVTGVSTGIGAATVDYFAARKFQVFGSVRKAADAEPFTKKWKKSFTPLVFDVTDPDGIAAGAESVKQAIGDDSLTTLVNNAGASFSGPLIHQSPEKFRLQFDVNVMGPFLVTQAFAPLLGAQKDFKGAPGRIINISSVGGRITAPFIGAYSGTKHALEALSDAWRRELLMYGIDVVVIQPGATKSAIWDKVELDEFDHTDYAPLIKRFADNFIEQGKNGVPASRVAKVIYKAATIRNPKTRYAVLRGKFMNFTLPQWLPDRMVDNTIAKQLGIEKPS